MVTIHIRANFFLTPLRNQKITRVYRRRFLALMWESRDYKSCVRCGILLMDYWRHPLVL